MKAASGDTYQSSETVPDGSRIETTYYDASGAILGYSSSWSNTEEGSSGRSFEDSDRNWLGDTLNDPARGFTSSFVRTDTKDSDGNVTGFIEQGSNKQVDPVTGEQF